MTRKEANLKILDILKEYYSDFKYIYEALQHYIELYPDQRFAQLWCNYICPDYRDSRPSVYTSLMKSIFFPNTGDPFFEESTETLKYLEWVINGRLNK